MSAPTRRSLLAATGLLALAACTRQDADETSAPNSPENGEPTMESSTEQTAPSRTLLIWFSRNGENYWEGGRRDLEVGNTERLVRLIAERIEVQGYEVVPADPYPEAYDPTVERNVREQNVDARPAIAGELPDAQDFNIVLIGSPVWNVRAPMILSTLVESLDLTGLRVLPFVTYAVSGMAGIDRDYREALPDSEVANGLAIRGEDIEAEDTVAEVEVWLRDNGLL